MSFDLPVLPDGWSYAPLETRCQQGSVTYGIVQPGTHVNDGKPIVRVNNFRDMRLDLTEVMRVAPEVEAKYRRTRLKGGEVLLTIVGSVGQVAVVPIRLAGFNVARAVAVIDPLPDVGPDWIALCLRSPLSQHLLSSRANTTVQTTINLKDLRALPIPLPCESERRGITSLIGALDDRITLLRETNATLEAIAQALFKSWFVDFDPVRAKMEGRAPEGMDETTAALFPDGFEESALGAVPKGWLVDSIYSVARVTYGAPFASKLFKAETPGRPLVRIRDLKDERPGVYTEEVHPKGYVLQPGDIAVGMDGEFRAYVWGGGQAWVNQRVCVFHPINGACSAFIRLLITPMLSAVEASETATTVIHLGKNDIDRFQVITPRSEVLTAFATVADPLYKRLVANKQQAQTFATLRDTLLPRLISGQLRLPEAQTLVEASV